MTPSPKSFSRACRSGFRFGDSLEPAEHPLADVSLSILGLVRQPGQPGQPGSGLALHFSQRNY